MARIVSTRFRVDGVNEDRDTKKAMQSLFDIFTAHGLGQATFEIVPGEPTRLWIKHKDDSTPSRALIAEALARAGDTESSTIKMQAWPPWIPRGPRLLLRVGAGSGYVGLTRPTYGFAYACFLVLGLALATTPMPTRDSLGVLAQWPS